MSRAAGSATYPSHFQLVAAMNPCKCGYYGHPTRQCTCSPSAVRQYRSRVSGPLLDRIDLCVEMDPIAFDELHTAAPAESSADLRKQVLAARAIQAKRYAAPGYEGVHCNAQLNAGQVRRICRMTPGAERLIRASYDALGLSARAHDRILRVARTVADLAGKSLLDEDSLLEALQYRAQEKVELVEPLSYKHNPLPGSAVLPKEKGRFIFVCFTPVSVHFCCAIVVFLVFQLFHPLDERQRIPGQIVPGPPGCHRLQREGAVPERKRIERHRVVQVFQQLAAQEANAVPVGGNRIGGNAVCDFVVFGRIASKRFRLRCRVTPLCSLLLSSFG